MTTSLVDAGDAWPAGWEALLAGSPADFRLLRRLSVTEGRTGDGDPEAPNVGIVVDVETTGLDPESDVVIELALRRIRFDDDGRVTEIGRAWSWLEDPGRSLSQEIVKLTGLTDADLAGRSIDDAAAARLLRSADLVVAHNASFDRPRVERRLPAAAGLRWACSLAEIDWRGRGFEGRGLGHLLTQAGLFHEAHRAPDDVDAVIGLLRHRFGDGSTALGELVATSWRPGWIARAVGASYDGKDDLKRRGYRWNGRAWWREVADDARDAEAVWLDARIYAPGARAKAVGPEWERVTNKERWS